MHINRFDVVELKDGNRATILDTNKKEYFAEIVNIYGVTIEKRNIYESEINKVIYEKK